MGRTSIPKWEGDAMKLSELTRDFIKDFERPVHGHSSLSAAKYEDDIRKFIAYVISVGGEDSVREFTPDRLNGFVRYCEDRGLSGTTIGAMLSALKSLARFGMQQKDSRGKYLLTEGNPLDRVARPKRGKVVERHLYRDEIKALLAVEAPANERLAILFLFYTQLRASAAVGAKRRDLSLDGERVRLEVIEKGNNPDTFVLPPALAEPLLAALREREAGPEETLLVNESNRPYTRQSLSTMLARNAIKAGITRFPVRAHVFARHSLASIAGQNGASVFEIAAMLRHRGISTAKKYVHGIDASALRERVTALVTG